MVDHGSHLTLQRGKHWSRRSVDQFPHPRHAGRIVLDAIDRPGGVSKIRRGGDDRSLWAVRGPHRGGMIVVEADVFEMRQVGRDGIVVRLRRRVEGRGLGGFGAGELGWGSGGLDEGSHRIVSKRQGCGQRAEAGMYTRRRSRCGGGAESRGPSVVCCVGGDADGGWTRG